MQNEKVKKYNYKIEKSKDNKDILIINNKYIHSKFNPSKEGLNFLHEGKNLIVIFGLGFAYHINNIIKNNPSSFFIIYEPCDGIFVKGKEYLDPELLTKYKNQICILTEISYQLIFDFLDRNKNSADLRIFTYSNIGYKQLFPELELEFYKSVKDTLQIIIQNLLTESNFIPLWTKNFLYNIKSLDKNHLLIPAKQELNNNIAVICCAGPSLEKDMEIIFQNRDKITIFAVDTAIKTLLMYSIIPDFIVSQDGQYYTMDDFVNKLPDETVLLLDSITYPEISKKYSNIFFLLTKSLLNYSIIDYFMKYFNISFSGIDSGGTVSDYCLSIAVYFGFKNIYFSGLDLSFPLFQSHCKGSPFHNRTLYYSDYFNTTQSMMINTISKRELKIAESKKEDTVLYSDFVLQNYAYYFSKFAESNSNLCLYTSKNDGIRINYINEISLDNLIKNTKSERILYSDLISDSDTIQLTKSRISEFFNFIINNIHKKSEEINNLFKITDFHNSDSDIIGKWLDIIQNTIIDFPFLKKFIIMTDIILSKKNISKDNILWYKHIGHKLLQSIYFVIRILQKITGNNP